MTVPRLDIVRRLMPQAKDIRSIDTGNVNEMIVVDDQTIFRFPRSLENIQQLAYESTILAELPDTLGVKIPKLLSYSAEDNYSVLSYIPGQVASVPFIAELTAADKQRLIRTLAGFMKELNRAISVEQLDSWQRQHVPDESSWDEYYDRLLESAKAHSHYQQYSKQYQRVKAIRDMAPPVPRIAIHGDLHAGNMIFHDNTLHAIVDFGDCEAGTIYNELRPLYDLGHEFMVDLITELGAELGDVSVELVREWSIMHELSVLVRGDTSRRASIARQHLQAWGYEGDVRDKAIIFDCFGVLTSENWIPFRRKYFSSETAKAFAQRMMGDYVVGRISAQEFVDHIAMAGRVPKENVRQSLTGTAPDLDLFAWIEAHKDTYKIGMLSNAGGDMLTSLFTDEQISLFDDTVLSYDVGLAKPDPKVYELAASRLGVKPEDCIFIDDKRSFCNAAEKVGMQSITYIDFEQFAQDIDKVRI